MLEIKSVGNKYLDQKWAKGSFSKGVQGILIIKPQ